MKRAKSILFFPVIVVWVVVTILSYSMIYPSFLSRSKNTNSSSNNNISMSSSSSEMLVANVAPFAWKFFSEMVMERPENILVSPLSIAACLSMIWSGVTRSSQADVEFQSLFQLPSEDSIPTLVNVLLKKENKNNNSNQMLSMSNSLWTSGEVDSKYVELVSSFASIQPLPTSFDPINDWVAKETNNHIPELFSSEDTVLDPNALAIAVNAIHFQGLWASPFDSTHTQPDTFTTFDNQQTYTANFMSKTIHTSLAQDVSSLGGATVLTLDYACPDAQQQCSSEESEFCAMLVLPKHNTVQSMKRVIQGFTKQVSSSNSNNNNNKASSDLYFSNDFRKQNVHVSLPRFELKQGPESLKEFFKGMGFQTAFSTAKNQFLRMTPNRGDTYLDDVMAAATMKVTEEGTVATAATAAIMMTRSLPPSVEFNRPFLFMVLHRPTRTPLFLSQVHNPDFL